MLVTVVKTRSIDTVPETKTAETEENDMRFKCKQIFRFLTTFACKGTNVISRSTFIIECGNLCDLLGLYGIKKFFHF